MSEVIKYVFPLKLYWCKSKTYAALKLPQQVQCSS